MDLETVEIEQNNEGQSFIVCSECNVKLCEAEHGDTLALLVRVAHEHATTCPALPHR